jgi:hypothetical protein
MSIAKLVCDAVVLTIEYPTFVDQYSREVFENSYVVYGRGAPALIQVIQRQIGRGDGFE